ncbi:MAG TPA: response regulator, partial [Verrucomicrobiae bacterium]|nr:response regulator [Verrucomicrobiae bacterium]
LSAGDTAPVCIYHGEPVSFLTRWRSEFAAFLAKRGKITPEEAAAFAAAGSDRLTLTRTGLLTLDELLAESRLFLLQELRRIAAAPSADFIPGIPPEPPLLYVPLPQFLYDEGTSAASPPAGATYPARTPEFYRVANLIAMQEEDVELLALVDGRRSVHEIRSAAADPLRAGRFLGLLAALGMIELAATAGEEAPPPPQVRNLFNRPLREEAEGEQRVDFSDLVEEVSESVEKAVGSERLAVPMSSREIDFEQAVLRDHAAVSGKNYYEIFGLSPQSFSFDRLKEAYFQRIRSYTPERFMELSGTTSTVAEEVLAIYSSAYNTLSNVVSKERYDELMNAGKVVGLSGEQDERLQASVQLQSGKVFLEMGEFENAEKALQDAYTLNPDHADTCAYLGWAIYCNPANRSSAAAREKAKNLQSRSLQMSKNPAAFAFRGWMLLDEGRDGLAEGEFQKALKLEPQHLHARKGLRQIGEKRESEKKGIFRKIFG